MRSGRRLADGLGPLPPPPPARRPCRRARRHGRRGLGVGGPEHDAERHRLGGERERVAASERDVGRSARPIREHHHLRPLSTRISPSFCACSLRSRWLCLWLRLLKVSLSCVCLCCGVLMSRHSVDLLAVLVLICRAFRCWSGAVASAVRPGGWRPRPPQAARHRTRARLRTLPAGVGRAVVAHDTSVSAHDPLNPGLRRLNRVSAR